MREGSADAVLTPGVRTPGVWTHSVPTDGMPTDGMPTQRPDAGFAVMGSRLLPVIPDGRVSVPALPSSRASAGMRPFPPSSRTGARERAKIRDPGSWRTRWREPGDRALDPGSRSLCSLGRDDGE